MSPDINVFMILLLYAVFSGAAISYFYGHLLPRTYQLRFAEVFNMIVRVTAICSFCLLAIRTKEDYFQMLVNAQQCLDDGFKLFNVMAN